jgi:hypothetical protein
MNYYIARTGQTYGPYSEETVRKYVSEGSMSLSDMGCTDANPSWVALSQLLGAPAQSGFAAAPPPPSYTPPAYAAPPLITGQAAAGINVPPNLHWALVLVIAIFTSGLFLTIWIFIQANWIKSINPASRAIRDLIIGIFAPFIGFVILIVMAVAGGISTGFDHMNTEALGTLSLGILALIGMGLVGLVFHIKAYFGMRDSMLRYYNSTEPINLRLSAVMTFFFNTLYFQYHMSRIADWKRTGYLRP